MPPTIGEFPRAEWNVLSADQKAEWEALRARYLAEWFALGGLPTNTNLLDVGARYQKEGRALRARHKAERKKWKE